MAVVKLNLGNDTNHAEPRNPSIITPLSVYPFRHHSAAEAGAHSRILCFGLVFIINWF